MEGMYVRIAIGRYVHAKGGNGLAQGKREQEAKREKSKYAGLPGTGSHLVPFEISNLLARMVILNRETGASRFHTRVPVMAFAVTLFGPIR